MQFDSELIKRLREAEHVVFFTGAGASAESGVPTFRESQNSIWADFDVNTYATAQGYQANPTLVWQWYAEQRRKLQALKPNPTHQVIAAWQHKMAGVTVITQNIDNLHQRAGSREMIELHGNIGTYKCFAQGHPVSHDAMISDEQPPHCEQCGSLLRPDVVWFEEELPVEAFNQAEYFSFNCDVFVSIGCSLEVYPASTLPIKTARCGAYLVQINPHETQLDDLAHCNLRGKAGEIMPLLWQAVWDETCPAN
jgi:NAD-dependent deacetylase